MLRVFSSETAFASDCMARVPAKGVLTGGVVEVTKFKFISAPSESGLDGIALRVFQCCARAAKYFRPTTVGVHLFMKGFHDSPQASNVPCRNV